MRHNIREWCPSGRTHNRWCTRLIPHPEFRAPNFPWSHYAVLSDFIRLYAAEGHFPCRVKPHNQSRKVAYSDSLAAYCRLFLEAALSGIPHAGRHTTTCSVPSNGNHNPSNQFFNPFCARRKKYIRSQADPAGLMRTEADRRVGFVGRVPPRGVPRVKPRIPANRGFPCSRFQLET